MEPAEILEVRSLGRLFGAVRALDGVDLVFREGSVHGVVGENGAGKSTLMNVLSGLVRPTSGSVLWKGRPVSLEGPADAVRLGIAMVHQELNLVEDLTVGDNVFLGRERVRRGFVDRKRTRAEASRILEGLGSRVDPDLLVSRLGIAERQMVEIARALSSEARVLILDEPTAVLGRDEVAALFEAVRRLRAEGRTVIHVSHLLSEVLEIADTVTVLRDGRVVRSIERPRESGTTEHDLARLMVGRELGEHFPAREAPSDEVALDVRLEGAEFSVRRGEIFGIAGLVGSGRTELAESIAGLRPRAPGTVLLEGRPFSPAGIREAVARGVAYLSEDRRGRGLVMGMDVVANTTLVSIDRYAGRAGLIDRRRETEAVLEHVRRLGIRIGRPEDPVSTLSGGNQQKVSFAKWLETEPRVLLLDEPTRGVDVGAKEEIYRLVRDLAQGGMATVLVSSELPEILGLAHRIAVMRSGRIVAIMDEATATEEAIMRYATGLEGASAA